MDIKLDTTHVLKSDNYCYWVVTIVQREGKGPYEKRVSGYYRELSGVLGSYIDTRIRSSDAVTLSELSQVIESLKTTVTDFCSALQETPHA